MTDDIAFWSMLLIGIVVTVVLALSIVAYALGI